MKKVLGLIAAGIVINLAYINFTQLDSSGILSEDINWSASFAKTKADIESLYLVEKQKLLGKIQIHSDYFSFPVSDKIAKKDFHFITEYSKRLSSHLAQEMDNNLGDLIDPVLVYEQEEYADNQTCRRYRGQLECEGSKYVPTNTFKYKSVRIPATFSFQKWDLELMPGKVSEAEAYRSWRWDAQNLKNYVAQTGQSEVLLRKSSSQLFQINLLGSWLNSYKTGTRAPVIKLFDSQTVDYPQIEELPAIMLNPTTRALQNQMKAFEYEIFEDFIAQQVIANRLAFINKYIQFLSENNAILSTESYLMSDRYWGHDIFPVNFSTNPLTSSERSQMSHEQIKAYVAIEPIKQYETLRDELLELESDILERSKENLRVFNDCATLYRSSISPWTPGAAPAQSNPAPSKFQSVASHLLKTCNPLNDGGDFSPSLESHIFSTAMLRRADFVMKQFQIEKEFKQFLTSQATHPVMPLITELENVMSTNSEFFVDSRFVASSRKPMTDFRVDVGSTLRRLVMTPNISLPASLSPETQAGLRELIDALKKIGTYKSCDETKGKLSTECRRLQFDKIVINSDQYMARIDGEVTRLAKELKIPVLYQANHIYGAELISYPKSEDVISRLLTWEMLPKPKRESNGGNK